MGTGSGSRSHLDQLRRAIRSRGIYSDLAICAPEALSSKKLLNLKAAFRCTSLVTISAADTSRHVSPTIILALLRFRAMKLGPHIVRIS